MEESNSSQSFVNGGLASMVGPTAYPKRAKRISHNPPRFKIFTRYFCRGFGFVQGRSASFAVRSRFVLGRAASFGTRLGILRDSFGVFCGSLGVVRRRSGIVRRRSAFVCNDRGGFMAIFLLSTVRRGGPAVGTPTPPTPRSRTPEVRVSA